MVHSNKPSRREVKEIINNRKIRTVFQPIISLKDGKILGHEALSRGPKNSAMESPEILFSLAREYEMLFELEKICREKALFNARKLSNKYKIFINVDPNVIYENDFEEGVTKDLLKELAISQKDVTIELTERTLIDDFKSFKSALDYYKKQGYQVAIDDTGSGYSGLQSIVSISYNYMKIDRSLITNIDQDEVKRLLLESLVEFAQKTDAKLIAEGIERREELNVLIDIGVDYGQGYLIARPAEEPKLSNDILQSILKKNKLKEKSIEGVRIGEIVEEVITVSVKTKTSVVVEIFEKNNTLQSIVILRDDYPVGIVMRNDLYSKLGTKYGYSIYMDRNIELLMDDKPLIVNVNESIDEVSRRAMDRELDNIYDSIIVTTDKSYKGVVSIRRLLDKLSKLKIEQAKHLNPLTNLPGNRVIEREVSNRIKDRELFSVLYIDLDNFKPYNDRYGYKKGDEVISFTANLLKEVIIEVGNEEDFVGHIGGDDFVVITTPDIDEMVSEEIINRFDRGIIDFFNEDDKRQGCMLGKSRQHKLCEFPLTSVSIAIVSNENRDINTHLKVSDIAAEIKSSVKKEEGSNYLKDRRKADQINF